MPGAPDADKSVAQSWTYSNAEDTFGTLRAEYDFNDYVTGWIAGGLRTSEEEGNFANPTVINTAGDTTAYRFYNVREDEVVTGDMGLRFTFTTGPVSHQLTTSASTYEMKSANAWAASSFAAREGLGNCGARRVCASHASSFGIERRTTSLPTYRSTLPGAPPT